jgi:hypothetical protein
MSVVGSYGDAVGRRVRRLIAVRRPGDAGVRLIAVEFGHEALAHDAAVLADGGVGHPTPDQLPQLLAGVPHLHGAGGGRAVVLVGADVPLETGELEGRREEGRRGL